MKVMVDESLCIGCGVCADISDKVFRMEGAVSIPNNNGEVQATEDQELSKTASECCPVQAISIIENDA